MKISEALKLAKSRLVEIDGGAFDALLLLMQATSLSKEKIVFEPDFLLDETQQKKFFALIERRKNREPVSHLIGKREFFGREFLVTRDVLDPRPDSEILVELALQHAAENSRILELGVGSGCLIITLLASLPDAAGVGIDVSAKALKIARENAEKNGVASRLKLIESDLFTGLGTLSSSSAKNKKAELELRDPKKFNLIISNPPYISTAEIGNLQDEVRLFEPRMALDGGSDGLNFYRRISAEAKKFLAENGAVIVEIGYGQKEKTAEIFASHGFQLIESKRDLVGIERALCFKSISQK